MKKSRGNSCILALVALALGSLASAQGPALHTRPGDTVRVWAGAPPIRGATAIVRRFGSDTIVFSVQSAVSRAWLETPVAQGQITRLDIRDVPRRSGRRTLLGIAGGALIGGALVGSLVYFTYDVSCQRSTPVECDADEFPPELDRAIYTIMGSAGGALVGGIVGGRMGSRPVVMWKRVFP